MRSFIIGLQTNTRLRSRSRLRTKLRQISIQKQKQKTDTSIINDQLEANFIRNVTTTGIGISLFFAVSCFWATLNDNIRINANTYSP